MVYNLIYMENKIENKIETLEDIFEQKYLSLLKMSENPYQEWQKSNLKTLKEINNPIRKQEYNVFIKRSEKKGYIDIMIGYYFFDNMEMKNIPIDLAQNAVDFILQNKLYLLSKKEILWEETQFKLQEYKKEIEKSHKFQ